MRRRGTLDHFFFHALILQPPLRPPAHELEQTSIFFTRKNAVTNLRAGPVSAGLGPKALNKRNTFTVDAIIFQLSGVTCKAARPTRYGFVLAGTALTRDEQPAAEHPTVGLRPFRLGARPCYF